jgi:hypothetical protein
MPRKAIDSRIPALIRNGVQEKKRSFFVVLDLHFALLSVTRKAEQVLLVSP